MRRCRVGREGVVGLCAFNCWLRFRLPLIVGLDSGGRVVPFNCWLRFRWSSCAFNCWLSFRLALIVGLSSGDRLVPLIVGLGSGWL